MYYIGLDIHKKTISYRVKDVAGKIWCEGTVEATRPSLDEWMKNLPQPWTAAMEATIFIGWVYDHLAARSGGEGGASVDVGRGRCATAICWCGKRCN